MPREDVIVRFGADIKSLQGSMSKVEAGFAGLSRAARTFGLALGGGAMASMVRETTRWADTLTNTSERVGVAVEQVQALRAEAEKFGVSTEQTDTALQRFSRRIGEAQQGTGTLLKVFEQYRIQLQDTQGRQRSVNALLEDFARVLQTIEDPAERNRIAMAAFDTEGVKLGQTLANLNGTIDDTTQALLEQGRIMREESIAAAAAFETKWTEMVQSANNTWRAFVVNVIDGWKTVLAGFDAADITQSIGGTFEITTQIRKQRQWVAELQDHVKNMPQWLQRIGGAQEKLNEAEAKLVDLQEQRNRQQEIFVAKRKAEAALSGLTAPGAITGGGRAGGGGGGARGGARATSAAASSQRALNSALDEYQRLIQSVETPQETFNRQIRELNDLRDRLAAGGVGFDPETYSRAVIAAQDQFNAAIEDANAALTEQKSLAEDLGLTFVSAFEDAIVTGASLRDVLQGLEQDILRIITRKLVTEPLGNAITGALGGSGSGGLFGGIFASIFGGARAAGGPVSAGNAYLVGEKGPELFVPRQSGQVMANGAGAINISVNVNGGSGRDMRESATQLATTIGRQVQRALARNG